MHLRLILLKANLCSAIKDWKWTYIKEEYNEFF